MKLKSWKLLLIILPLFILGFWAWQNDLLPSLDLEKDAFYIAISGPMSGKSKANGIAMVEGVQLYLSQVNRQGGINGKPVKLLIFDDQNKTELASANALEIATKTPALAVIGHYTSSASLAAAPIYQKYGIPAISGSATADELTKNNDWYFRTIFNNSDQGALLANYVYKVLHHDTAHILFDENAYGSTLASAFIQSAKLIGLSVKHQWHFNSTNQTNVSHTIRDMVATLKTELDNPGILFLATHSTEAVEAITELRRLGRKIPIIGADALSSSNFLQKLSNYPQERTRPGYYSDGIYTTSPFLFDIANERAQDFRHAFVKKYQIEPKITSAMYYDAAVVALHGIKQALVANQMMSLPEKRYQVRESLLQLSRLENALEGVTGYLYFDENGDVIQSIPVGIYKSGQAIAAMRQYQALTNLRNIENLLQKVLDNEIIQVNGKFMSLAQVVYVGIDFNDISELDPKSSTFTTDFYLWFRFRGHFDDKNINFVNIFSPEATHLLEPILERESSLEPGVTTRTYRFKTQFKVHFDFHDYPLDQQILPIYFRHNVLTRDKLIYVVDMQGMNIEQLESQGITSSPESKHFFSIGGWYIYQLSFFQNTQTNDSTLGLPELFGEQQRIEYSQFNAVLKIERHLLNFVLKNLLPTLFLVVLGYIAFFLGDFKLALTMGVNMIVATSLFHLKLSAEMPKIDYLFLMEYFFYMVYALAIFIIVIQVILEHLSGKDTEKSKIFAIRLRRFSKILYPIFILVFVGTITIIKN